MKTTLAYYKCNLCGREMKRKTSGRRTWIPSFCEEFGKLGRLYRIKRKTSPVGPRYVTCEYETCGWKDGIREDCVKDGKANGYCDKCDGERTFNLK